jgi:hypothetical protein
MFKCFGEMSRNYLPGDAEWEISARNAVIMKGGMLKGTKMIPFPRQLTVAMTLLFSFACVSAGAAQVAILAPADQDTIHDNSGNLAVAVKVEPPINPKDGTSIRILLDGKPAARDSSRMNFILTGVERGEHSLQALLIDRQGHTLSVSDTVDFTMWQASVNAPPRKGKP